jgi:hypothetical protein
MKAIRFIGAGCPARVVDIPTPRPGPGESWLRSVELAPAILIYMSLSTGAGALRRSLPLGMKMRVGLRNLAAGLTAGSRATPLPSTRCGGAATAQLVPSQPRTTVSVLGQRCRVCSGALG